MMALTTKQAKCFNFLVERINKNRTAPSCEEICAYMGLVSKGGAFRLLNRLEERGYIRRLKGQARAIEIIDRSSHYCPACGHQFSSSGVFAPSTTPEATGDNASPPAVEVLGGPNSLEAAR